MNWISLTNSAQLQEIASSPDTSIIFKHSTRCSVSSMARRQFEFEEDVLPADAKLYLLDLIRFRELSNEVAEHWAIRHESPQVLVIRQDRCIYSASHSGIEGVKVAVAIQQDAG